MGFAHADGRREIPGDWYAGTVPANIEIDPTAYLGSSHSFVRYKSERPVGLRMDRGASLCDGCSLDVGPRGSVRIREFAMVTTARILCDSEIDIGAYVLIAWNVVLMDSYRVPTDPHERRRVMLSASTARRSGDARPIRLGDNSWLGFGVCVLPGVTVGEGSIVAARSVVATDVPPYVVVAGNPARVVRELPRG